MDYTSKIYKTALFPGIAINSRVFNSGKYYAEEGCSTIEKTPDLSFGFTQTSVPYIYLSLFIGQHIENVGEYRQFEEDSPRTIAANPGKTIKFTTDSKLDEFLSYDAKVLKENYSLKENTYDAILTENTVITKYLKGGGLNPNPIISEGVLYTDNHTKIVTLPDGTESILTEAEYIQQGLSRLFNMSEVYHNDMDMGIEAETEQNLVNLSRNTYSGLQQYYNLDNLTDISQIEEL